MSQTRLNSENLWKQPSYIYMLLHKSFFFLNFDVNIQYKWKLQLCFVRIRNWQWTPRIVFFLCKERRLVWGYNKALTFASVSIFLLTWKRRHSLRLFHYITDSQETVGACEGNDWPPCSYRWNLLNAQSIESCYEGKCFPRRHQLYLAWIGSQPYRRRTQDYVKEESITQRVNALLIYVPINS